MEGSFADAFNNHGAKRARWRGLARQRIQSWLIAAVQNLRVLLRNQDHKPARAAAAMAEVWRAVGQMAWLRGFLAGVELFLTRTSSLMTVKLYYELWEMLQLARLRHENCHLGNTPSRRLLQLHELALAPNVRILTLPP
jgi:hypothetical protein